MLPFGSLVRLYIEDRKQLTLDSEFEALFNTYQQSITTYLNYLLGDVARSEELAQETFLRAYRELERGLQVEHPKAWLYRIATHIANDHFRRARLVQWLPLLDVESESLLQAPNPADDIPEQLAVRAALARLKPQYRIPLVLHLCEELSTTQIAEILGLTRGAVKMRLLRAREQFRCAFRAVSGAENEG